MKHPVLSIKKGAEFYDDARPEANRPVRHPPHPPPSTPPRKRGRASFFPLLFLALAVLAVLRFMPHGPTDRATVAGWQVVLRATPHEETLIIGVTFIAAKPVEGSTENPPDASVHVVAPDTGAELTLSGQLTKSPMTLRGELPYSVALKRIQADVTVAGAKTRLSLSSRAAH
jgi:hypothetical protein